VHRYVQQASTPYEYRTCRSRGIVTAATLDDLVPSSVMLKETAASIKPRWRAGLLALSIPHSPLPLSITSLPPSSFFIKDAPPCLPHRRRRLHPRGRRAIPAPLSLPHDGRSITPAPYPQTHPVPIQPQSMSGQPQTNPAPNININVPAIQATLRAIQRMRAKEGESKQEGHSKPPGHA
jgi:hypothetical protein